jgi:microcystin-dependent protein
MYRLLGTSFGGDGTNNFALPDLQGRVVIHNTDQYPRGVKGGAEAVTLTVAQLPAHSHVPHASTGNTPNNNGPLNGYWASNNSQLMYAQQPGDVAMNAGGTTTAGEGMPHENRIPFIAVNYIIATGGIWPDRG